MPHPVYTPGNRSRGRQKTVAQKTSVNGPGYINEIARAAEDRDRWRNVLRVIRILLLQDGTQGFI